jgi:hypothetical protein
VKKKEIFQILNYVFILYKNLQPEEPKLDIGLSAWLQIWIVLVFLE